ncbi:MAG: M4 family metallopeptidase [Gammaproteobacteria bacterium]|nr:M4 family metallopeptidase [Gammaproteobacteria bacterium]
MCKCKKRKIRKLAIEAIDAAAAMRTQRMVLATLPVMSAIRSPSGKKHRLVYDAKHAPTWDLPGKLVRGENDQKTKDASVNEAYRYSGYVYDF